jgi:hypothetical protein
MVVQFIVLKLASYVVAANYIIFSIELKPASTNQISELTNWLRSGAFIDEGGVSHHCDPN